MALEVKKRYPIPHSTRPHKLPQRVYKREQRAQSLRRFTTGTLILVLLAIVVGVGYTWYMGRHKTALANDPTPSRTIRPVLKPLKVSSIAPVGVSTQMITSPIKAGDNASITIKTNPEADCTIVAKYNNVPAQDSGLVAKSADEYGVASWAWTVAPSAPKGTWPVEVTCKNKKNSAVVKADLVVQ
jgi:hypothetical protein